VRVVLDTNVVVSGLLSPGGPCGKILDEVLEGSLDILLDSAILAEYESVLGKAQLKIPPGRVRPLLANLAVLAEYIPLAPAGIKLPHSSDAKFLQCALAGNADYLVTGNLRHFSAKACRPVVVLSPADFLAAYFQR
jgi:putative PIN family toxin of toxin-antitoxin system